MLIAELFALALAAAGMGWLVRGGHAARQADRAYDDGWAEGRQDLHEAPTVEFTRSRIAHGTNSSYHRGCHCARCRQAHAAAYRDYYARRKQRDPGWSPRRKTVTQLALF
jgi:hypothetical protein